MSLAPDSFLIDQAKATMMQIVNLNMYKQMDHWYIYISYELARDGRKGGRIGVTSWNLRCRGEELEKKLQLLWSAIQTTAQANL